MRNIISLAPDPTLGIYSASAAPPTKWPATLGHGASNYITVCEKGCGFLAIRYLEVHVKLYQEVQSGLNNLSVIVNWEVVHSSEVRNVLSLWQIQSIP